MTRQLVTRTNSRPIELSIVGEDLPSEFRIFRAGWNDTEKGSVLFDAEAANSVMASAAKWGVDFMIDLEHQAVTSATPPEPTARDARGWFRVELRAGELWAVNVKWTEDGAARLLSKRQRYISPAFSYDPETSRVLSLLNVAIVAMPATHEAQPLMAASMGECMDPELLKQAMDALIAGDAEKCMEILKGIITSAAGGEEAAEAEAPPADPAAEMSAEAPPPADEKKEEMLAAVRAEFNRERETLATERRQLAAERAELEREERHALCVKMVHAGEHPARVWDDPMAIPLAPKAYLSAMPIAVFRRYAADAIGSLSARGYASRSAAQPPIVGNTGDRVITTRLGVVTLSASEIQSCEEVGAKLEDFALNKAIRAKSRGAKG